MPQCDILCGKTFGVLPRAKIATKKSVANWIILCGLQVVDAYFKRVKFSEGTPKFSS